MRRHEEGGGQLAGPQQPANWAGQREAVLGWCGRLVGGMGVGAGASARPIGAADKAE